MTIPVLLRAISRVVFMAILAVALSVPGTAQAHGGGKVLPPSAHPHGYTLEQMVRATAPFSTSGNDLARYPRTPFQILYVDFTTVTVAQEGNGLVQTGVNSFRVSRGTSFFVPVWNATDSPPVAGTFPGDRAAARDYFFDQSQLGGRNFEILVDGKSTPLGRGYVTGPVRATVLDDDGDPATPLGERIVTVGAFVGPLRPGTHRVEIRGGLYGDLIPGVAGGAAFIREDFTYTVKVVRHRSRS